ncbi:MAG: flagellar protein FlaG [Spirochaetales bacterium]
MSIEISGVLGHAGHTPQNTDQRQRQGTPVDKSPEGLQSLEAQIQTREQPIDGLIQELENISSALNRRLKFSVNRELEQVVVQVVDQETDKVIKELPPEGIQRLYAKMQEALGMLIDEEI